VAADKLPSGGGEGWERQFAFVVIPGDMDESQRGRRNQSAHDLPAGLPRLKSAGEGDDRTATPFPAPSSGTPMVRP
jgi:hypothetical protein